MKYAFLIFALISLKSFNTCNCTKNNTVISAIEVKSISAMMGEDFYRVYRSGDLIMYHNRYKFDSSENLLKFDSTTNEFTSHSNLLLSEMRDQFFLLHKDSVFGYNYDPNSPQKDNIRLRADSTLKIRTLQPGNLDTILVLVADTSIWNTDKTILKEIYNFQGTKAVPSHRWVFYYSTKLNDIKESFSQKLDSVKKMKLFKTEYIFDEFHRISDNTKWPTMIYSNELQKMLVENSREIYKYFERYKENLKSPH